MRQLRRQHYWSHAVAEYDDHHHGDPRDGTVDLVDWIERIPFDETRDYVERVSENLGVYRQRFADEKLAPPPVSARVARE